MRPACARFSDRLRIGVAFALSLLVHVFVAFIAPGVLRPMRPTVLPATLAVELLVSTGEVPPAPSAELAETEFGVTTGPPQKLHARAVQPKLERSSASSGPADRPDPTYYGARDLDVYPTLTAALELQHARLGHEALLEQIVKAGALVAHRL